MKQNSSRLGAALAMTTVASAMVGGGIATANSASATADSFTGISSPTFTDASGKANIVHFGTLLYGATNTLCIDAGVDSPDSINTAGQSSASNAEISYLASKYIKTTDSVTAAALSWEVRQLAPDGHLNDAVTAMNAIKTSEPSTYQAIMAKAAAMDTEAKANMGPYTTTASLSGTSLSNVALQSAAGNDVAGYTGTITLTGTTFADGSTTKSITSDATAQSFDVKAPASGTTANATVTFNGVPSTTYTVYAPAVSGQQRLAAQGADTTSTKSVSFSATNTPTPSTPTVTTQASSQTANVGDKIYDTVNGSGFPAGATVKGSDKLTDASGNTVTTIPWTATADANGSFSVKTDTYTVTKAGTYTWVESSEAGGTGDHTYPSTQGKPGDTTETTTVNTPNTPTVTTQASSQTANVGDKIYDTVNGSGFPAGATVKGSDKLTDASGNVVATVPWTATADDKGSFSVKTDTYTVTKAGTYTWVESSEAGGTGDHTYPSTQGKPGDTAETTTVTKPGVPVITTQTSSQTANVGDKIYDTINGSGFPAGATVKGSDKLTDASGKVVTTVPWTATADANGSFSVKTDSYTVTKAGTYTWVESSEAGGTGDHTFPATQGKPGDKAETTTVSTPGHPVTPTPVKTTPVNGPTIQTDHGSSASNGSDGLFATSILGGIGALGAVFGARRKMASK